MYLKKMRRGAASLWFTVMLAAVALVLLVVTATSANARTIFVATTGDDTTGDGSKSKPYATIQKGVDVAADSGDTVQVAMGTYYEPIVWEDKSLSMVGAGADQTIIDGAQFYTCLGVASANGSVTGITMQRGLADYGAGLYVSDSSLSVVNCAVVGNVAIIDGGGIFAANSDLVVENSFIAGNDATFSGGGIAVEDDSSLQLSKSEVVLNHSNSSGGGVFVSRSAATIKESSIVANSVGLYGGGINLYIAAATIEGTEIAINLTFARGGGLYARESNLSADCLFVEQNGAYDRGGGLYLWDTSATMTNGVVAGNLSPVAGGLYLRSTESALTNITVADNRSDGVITDSSGSQTITNCVLWGNGGVGDLVGTTATYSDIGSGETTGAGNISADPLFVGGGDYHLRAGSPCINVGNNAAGLPKKDIDGDQRVISVAVDMGADEAHPYQPDLWIKRGKSWLGDDIYNDSGTGQTCFAGVSAGATKKYLVRIQNDGGEAETIWINCPAGDENWTVRYFQGDIEITDLVTGVGWNRKVQLKDLIQFRIEVTPTSGLAIGERFAVLVRAESDRDPNQQDTIRAVTRVK